MNLPYGGVSLLFGVSSRSIGVRPGDQARHVCQRRRLRLFGSVAKSIKNIVGSLQILYVFMIFHMLVVFVPVFGRLSKNTNILVPILSKFNRQCRQSTPRLIRIWPISNQNNQRGVVHMNVEVMIRHRIVP